MDLKSIEGAKERFGQHVADTIEMFGTCEVSWRGGLPIELNWHPHSGYRTPINYLEEIAQKKGLQVWHDLPKERSLFLSSDPLPNLMQMYKVVCKIFTKADVSMQLLPVNVTRDSPPNLVLRFTVYLPMGNKRPPYVMHVDTGDIRWEFMRFGKVDRCRVEFEIARDIGIRLCKMYEAKFLEVKAEFPDFVDFGA